jgi:hypothetical protein
MTGFKVFLIFLALVLIAFVLMEVVGTVGSGQKMDANTFSNSPHPALESMNAVLEPFSPKLKLTTEPVLLSAAPGKDHIVLPAPADNDHPIRFAAFALSAAGCADITYIEPGKAAVKWPPDARHAADIKGTILIGAAGGSVGLALRKPSPACQIAFQN